MARVQPLVDAAARRAATGARSHAELARTKNASWGRWVGGWPIFPQPTVPGGTIPAPTPIATAIGNLIAGPVDLFAQAVTNVAGSTNPFAGGFSLGQQPWNNFLGQNQRVFNVLYPEMGGVYCGNLWDMVSGLPGAQAPMSGFYSSLIENCILILQKNQNNEAFMPWLMTPPGIRLDRRASSTVDNALVTTEGFGSLDGRGLKKFREDERWSGKTQLGLQLTPSAALKAFIASLTTEFIPASGSIIAFVGHGVEIRPVTVGA